MDEKLQDDLNPNYSAEKSYSFNDTVAEAAKDLLGPGKIGQTKMLKNSKNHLMQRTSRISSGRMTHLSSPNATDTGNG